MSYLVLDEGVPDFSKAVISFWFRVPQASVDAAAAAYQNDGSPLDGIIPLVIMGKQGSYQKINTEMTEVPTQIFDETGASTAVQRSYTYVAYDGGGTPLGTLLYSVCTTNFWVECVPSGVAPTMSTTKVFNTTGDPLPTNPTCIGLDCSSGSATLYVNFETATKPVVTGAASELSGVSPVTETSTGCYDFLSAKEGSSTDFCFSTGGSAGPPPGGYPSGINFGDHTTPFVATGSTSISGGDGAGNPIYHYTDISDIKYGTTGAIESNVIPISADKWHHVLISVNINDIKTHGIALGTSLGSIADGTDSAATLYIALDDKDKTKLDLSENWVDGGDDHAVITRDAYDIINLPPSVDEPNYSLSGATVPSNGIALGIPGVSQYTNAVRKVEMAEFLMWTDVMLDTSIEENRRLFIVPDKKGVLKPVNPSPIYIPISKTAVGDPTTWEDGADLPAFVPPPSAFYPSAVGSGNKVLGTPDIEFTKASLNWMMGRNLGSLKGKVVRTGKIKAYFPDPSIPVGD